MGVVAAKTRNAWRSAFGRVEHRIVMFGFDAAGKTTILYKLKVGEVVTTIPTIGFNVESIVHNTQCLTIWDCGLRDKARPLLRYYVENHTDALVLVVDSNDRDRIEDVREFMFMAISFWVEQAAKGKLSSKPRFLVYANKQDFPDAMTVAELTACLGLDSPALRDIEWHVQATCATTGEGLYEGLDFLTHGNKHNKDKHDLALASTGLSSSEDTDNAIASKSCGVLEPADVPEDDEEFMQLFMTSKLARCDVQEILRASYLQRTRIPGVSKRICFESAKRYLQVIHATRIYFWINRLFEIPITNVLSSLEFLQMHRDKLPFEHEAQEAIIHSFYSEDILQDPTSALIPLPPDRISRSSCSGESDELFLNRVEDPEKLRLHPDEILSSYSLSRLAFVLLRLSDTRRAAISRMDKSLKALAAGWTLSSPSSEEICKRPFHETRQYVALQLVHAAMAERPDLCIFNSLAEVYPQLCEEDAVLQYYSEECLDKGCTEFVVPDLKPLPTKVSVSMPSWHKEINDEIFLEHVCSGSLSSWGLPTLARMAYLFLKFNGRRDGLACLLREADTIRKRPALYGCQCAHETLAYLMMHIVHFQCSRSMWDLAENSFEAFASEFPSIFNSQLPAEFYSDALFYSREARLNFVMPDLRPLPDLVPRSNERTRAL